MTVDPDPLAERSRTIDQDDLEMAHHQADHDDLEAVAEVGDDVKDLL